MKNVTHNSSGITLISLIITILVLLILAGVTISMAIGQNGILTRSQESVTEHKEAETQELIQLMLAEYLMQKNKTDIDLESFLNQKQTSENLDEVINNNNGTITVKLNEVELTIDENNLSIVDPEKTEVPDVVIPEFATTIYQTTGDDIVSGEIYEELIVTVNVTNKQNLGKINSIIMKNSSGTEIRPEKNVIGKGDASFKVSETGDYTIEVTSTTSGISKSTNDQISFPEGGILGIVSKVPHIASQAEAREAVTIMLGAYAMDKYSGITLIEFLNNELENNKLDKVTQNGGIITVQLNGFKIKIDEKTEAIIE